MREPESRQSPPVDSWLAFAIRCIGAVAFYILSFCAQNYMDDVSRSIVVRCLAVLGYVFGLSIALIWLYRWARRADEYQRLLTFRNLAMALISSMGIFIAIHIVYVFDNPPSHDWPIMGMPAYGILFAVIGSRPKKS
ncbi:hypothetical protein [Asticcacaulis sp.]|uniref:hypothetical protein n=1 Tax=Asticcacaulis sp. TaxID=1872648 RepID=UPI002C90E227|nr:hypothetical protein [Asticcacaulis sp.]HTM80212.1 hypothetical protein [Asticcacaulis sp.]